MSLLFGAHLWRSMISRRPSSESESDRQCANNSANSIALMMKGLLSLRSLMVHVVVDYLVLVRIASNQSTNYFSESQSYNIGHRSVREWGGKLFLTTFLLNNI